MRKINKLTKMIEKLQFKVAATEGKIMDASLKCEAGKITKAERERLKMRYSAHAAALRAKIRRLEQIRLLYERKRKEKEEQKEKKRKEKEEKIRKKLKEKKEVEEE